MNYKFKSKWTQSLLVVIAMCTVMVFFLRKEVEQTERFMSEPAHFAQLNLKNQVIDLRDKYESISSILVHSEALTLMRENPESGLVYYAGLMKDQVVRATQPDTLIDDVYLVLRDLNLVITKDYIYRSLTEFESRYNIALDQIRGTGSQLGNNCIAGNFPRETEEASSFGSQNLIYFSYDYPQYITDPAEAEVIIRFRDKALTETLLSSVFPGGKNIYLVKDGVFFPMKEEISELTSNQEIASTIPISEITAAFRLDFFKISGNYYQSFHSKFFDGISLLTVQDANNIYAATLSNRVLGYIFLILSAGSLLTIIFLEWLSKTPLEQSSLKSSEDKSQNISNMKNQQNVLIAENIMDQYEPSAYLQSDFHPSLASSTNIRATSPFLTDLEQKRLIVMLKSDRIGDAKDFLQSNIDDYAATPYSKEALPDILQQLKNILQTETPEFLVSDLAYSMIDYGDFENNAQDTIRSYVNILLDEYDKFLSYKTPQKNSDPINKIQAFILDNLADETLSARLIADELHYSEKYIYKLIKDEEDLTLNRYIQVLRLNEAYRLIRESNDPITEISAAVGYSSYNSFYKAFVSCFGDTPTNVRKL